MAWTAAHQEAANAGRFLMEGSAVSVRDARRVVASPFLVKTYRLVDDSSTDHIVSWGDHGNNFVVWRPKEFSASVLPLYFKHTKFSSFVRQLNTYGFRKMVRGRCVFTNELFRKGQKHLLSHIQRRESSSTSTMQPLHIVEYDKSSSVVANSSSTVQDSVVPAAAPSLSQENEILRRNISFLFSEIARLQNICTEISRYLFGRKPGISMDRKRIDNAMYRKMDNFTGSSTMTDVAEQININPPELFGVSL